MMMMLLLLLLLLQSAETVLEVDVVSLGEHWLQFRVLQYLRPRTKPVALHAKKKSRGFLGRERK